MFGSTDYEERKKNEETYAQWKDEFQEILKHTSNDWSAKKIQNFWLELWIGDDEDDPTYRVMIVLPLIVYQINKGILTKEMEEELYCTKEDFDDGFLDEIPETELNQIKKDLEFCFSRIKEK